MAENRFEFSESELRALLSKAWEMGGEEVGYGEGMRGYDTKVPERGDWINNKIQELGSRS